MVCKREVQLDRFGSARGVHVKREHDELQAEQEHVMAEVRDGGDEQHRAEHELKDARRQRHEPFPARCTRLERLVDLVRRLLETEQAPHDGDDVERLRRVEQGDDTEDDHDDVRADRDLAGDAALIEQVRDDIRGADEQHDGSEDMRQVLGDLLREQQAGDAEDWEKQGGHERDSAWRLLAGKAAIHLHVRHGV